MGMNEDKIPFAVWVLIWSAIGFLLFFMVTLVFVVAKAVWL
jgi:hypothetical protein